MSKPETKIEGKWLTAARPRNLLIFNGVESDKRAGQKDHHGLVC